jgi:polysaccharide export outer membrane protein
MLKRKLMKISVQHYALPSRGPKQQEKVVNTLQNKLIRILAGSALVVGALALGGCSSFRSAGPTPAAGPEPTSDYLIGPGDAISVNVWRNPEVSQTVPVRPDGKITTPLVEDLPASGKTSTELARDIEKALSKYIQQPVVTVIVTGFVGTYGEQIRVIGQAAKPQSLPYRRDMSLMDVLIAVGGVTEFAAGNKASIIRSVDGKQQQFVVRLNDLIKDGDISANVPMRPGDILVIPESFF